MTALLWCVVTALLWCLVSLFLHLAVVLPAPERTGMRTCQPFLMLLLLPPLT